MDDDSDLYDRIRAMADAGDATPSIASPSGANWASGLMQSALSLGQSYLSRRIDIDLQQRLAGAQPNVQRLSNQNPLQSSPDLTTRGVQAVGGMRMGDMLPIVALCLGAWFFFGPKRGS